MSSIIIGDAIEGKKTLWYTFPGTLPAPSHQGHMQLTLLIPELIWPEPEDQDTLDELSCPALSTLLARSMPSHRPKQSLETLLAGLFGQVSSFAAFRRLGESGAAVETSDDFWVCSDPVHLRFHQDRLILADSARFDIALDEAHTLVDALNVEFPDIGRFDVATAERWYLRLADTPPLEFPEVPPLSSVAGRSIERLLPETSEAKDWRKLLNETQMLLHAHPVNQKRESENHLPINSLWLWGYGALPPRIESRFDGVWSNNPLALGLARAAGVPTHPTPIDATSFLQHCAPDTDHLIVLEDLHEPVNYEIGEAYRNALNELEKHWFAPLHSLLASGRISQLRIKAPTAYASLAWEIRRRDLWKLWRVPQPLAALARELAKK